MKYRLLEGVVYTRVCGQNILVACRSAWGKCPYTKRLSALRGAFWQGLGMGMTEEQIVSELLLKTNIRKEIIEKKLAEFIEIMTEQGYLTEQEDDS